MKIVVRAPNWIGDVVLSLPALENLKRNLPQAQIWIAARKEVQDLYSSFDFVKGIILLSELNNYKNLREASKKIKEYDFGYILCFQRIQKKSFFIFLTVLSACIWKFREFRLFRHL